MNAPDTQFVQFPKRQCLFVIHFALFPSISLVQAVVDLKDCQSIDEGFGGWEELNMLAPCGRS